MLFVYCNRHEIKFILSYLILSYRYFGDLWCGQNHRLSEIGGSVVSFMVMDGNLKAKPVLLMVMVISYSGSVLMSDYFWLVVCVCSMTVFVSMTPAAGNKVPSITLHREANLSKVIHTASLDRKYIFKCHLYFVVSNYYAWQSWL